MIFYFLAVDADFWTLVCWVSVYCDDKKELKLKSHWKLIKIAFSGISFD